MSNTVSLGGKRLGSGKNQKISLHGFERSTHDLGFVWRNTQAPGTLVPFMVQLALPGDSFDINLQADVKTHPTIGPLFASFKLQLDVFECPIRLYHAWLHNNKLKVGNDMSKVKLPLLQFNGNRLWFAQNTTIPLEQQQINQSSLLSYLGIRGLGGGTAANQKCFKNAIPYIAYWDIYKNYYANKAEEVGMMIDKSQQTWPLSELTINAVLESKTINIQKNLSGSTNYTFVVKWYGTGTTPTKIRCIWLRTSAADGIQYTADYTATSSVITGGFLLTATVSVAGWSWTLLSVSTEKEAPVTSTAYGNIMSLTTFPLDTIDTMREALLSTSGSAAYQITAFSNAPYGNSLRQPFFAASEGQMAAFGVQQGLAIKTYQSDIFNNWLNTEWIDGTAGINEITSIDTSDGSFSLDTLNLSKKVYNMLNRIAIAGGSYEDWVSAVYDHQGFTRAESPMYHGGLSKEIIFQEVVSQSETATDPLGTLAGKGHMSNKHKGGKVSIKVQEPSYIIGIVSITPRLDYFQGTDFHTLHTTMNDLHKPSLDEIGFQELVTDKMAFWDTVYDAGGTPTFKSAGKQPAWIDYMTNYNRLHGNFADSRNEMYMTLARRYEPNTATSSIKDLTTYIDPTKFNYAFAQTDITAMNFWVQIGADITARRKMSSKIMPNL